MAGKPSMFSDAIEVIPANIARQLERELAATESDMRRLIRTHEALKAQRSASALAREAIEQAVADQKGKCCDNCNCQALKALYASARTESGQT